MDREQVTRRLIRGIIAFDAIMQHILSDIEHGSHPHEMGLEIMDALAAQLFSTPEITHTQSEFIKNMADLAARIRMHTICVEPDNEKLVFAIGRIKERLRELGPRNVYDMGAPDGELIN